jgi:hypothetical protein
VMNATRARAWMGNETPLPKRKWGLTSGLWWAFGFLVLTCGVGDVITTAIAVNSTQAAEGNALVANLLQGGFGSFVAIKVLFLLAVYGLACGLIVVAWPRWLKVFQVGLWVYAASFAVISVSNLMAAYLGDDLLNFIANHTGG